MLAYGGRAVEGAEEGEEVDEAEGEEEEEVEFDKSAYRKETLRLFKQLHIKGERLKELGTIFQSMDKDNSGDIDLTEFIEYFSLESQQQFARKVFSIFDKDKSGELDFEEFVAGLWNLASYDEKSLVKVRKKISPGANATVH